MAEHETVISEKLRRAQQVLDAKREAAVLEQGEARKLGSILNQSETSAGSEQGPPPAGSCPPPGGNPPGDEPIYNRTTSAESRPRRPSEQLDHYWRQADKVFESRTSRTQWERALRYSMAPKRHLHGVTETGGKWDEWSQAGVRLNNAAKPGAIIGLVGPRGTGKTQMAVEVIKGYLAANYIAMYVKAMDIFLSIRESYGAAANSSERRAVEYWMGGDLLVIDELQVRGETEWENRLLTHIVDKRYDAMKTTLLVANYTPDELAEAVGASIARRIEECGGVIECDWESWKSP